ncbi:MAG: glycoside hydrolase family 2 sugar binding, partial [Bacteroidetes bacterium]|nr:glycoside hydrolase family 2 sugar binding [Bacteroidota bacterium]
PFTANITGLFKKGRNTIEIKITNQWTNRLIGDQRSARDKKILNSPVMVLRRDLNESGLLGPVKILKYHDYEETW